MSEKQRFVCKRTAKPKGEKKTPLSKTKIKNNLPPPNKKIENNNNKNERNKRKWKKVEGYQTSLKLV